MSKYVSQAQPRLLNTRSKSSWVIGVFYGLGQEKVWYRSFLDKPNGAWDHTAKKMSQKFAEASHPGFFCAEPLSKGDSFSEYGSNKIIVVRTILARSKFCIYTAKCVWSDPYK